MDMDLDKDQYLEGGELVELCKGAAASSGGGGAGGPSSSVAAKPGGRQQGRTARAADCKPGGSALVEQAASRADGLGVAARLAAAKGPKAQALLEQFLLLSKEGESKGKML